MEDMVGKPVAPSHRSYKIEVTSNTSNIKPDQKATIKYKIKNDKGEPLKNYEIVHEKIMHFITVRKDLQHFQHLHPNFDQTIGEFAVDVTFPKDGPYRIFLDFTPGEENSQKLPVTVFYDVAVGEEQEYKTQVVVADTERTKNKDGYQITYTLPHRVQKQKEVTYSLNVQKDGQPITDLDQYLGALGHSVIMKEGTLDFIHTHAGEAPSTSSGPEISFTTTFPESGIYKIFTQFQHQGKVVTTEYVLNVVNE